MDLTQLLEIIVHFYSTIRAPYSHGRTVAEVWELQTLAHGKEGSRAEAATQLCVVHDLKDESCKDFLYLAPVSSRAPRGNVLLHVCRAFRV